jgi:hypothetical protein
MTNPNQYFLNLIAGRDPNLRAADADREQTAERLRKGHAEGRLDTDEFQQRLEQCYDAKTFGELGELVRDLPRPDTADERGSLGWSRPLGWHVAPVAVVLVALLFASAAAGHHVFWLWLPLVFLFWRLGGWRRRRWMAGTRRFPNDWI